MGLRAAGAFLTLSLAICVLVAFRVILVGGFALHVLRVAADRLIGLGLRLAFALAAGVLRRTFFRRFLTALRILGRIGFGLGFREVVSGKQPAGGAREGLLVGEVVGHFGEGGLGLGRHGGAP